jgi:hypothetical protein
MTGFLSAYIPTVLVCALFFWWSRASGVPWLSRLLRASSLVCALYFLVLLVLVFIMLATCDGSFFEGVENCAPMPDFLAKLIRSLTFMSYALGIFYALILVAAGGLVEALKPPTRD